MDAVFSVFEIHSDNPKVSVNEYANSQIWRKEEQESKGLLF